MSDNAIMLLAIVLALVVYTLADLNRFAPGFSPVFLRTI